MKPSLELTEDDFDSSVSVILKGVFFCSQAAAKQMVKQGGGKIINIAAMSAGRAISGQCAYASCKAGVIALTKVMGIELAPFGINVNAVSPGGTRTPAFIASEAANPEYFKVSRENVPIKRHIEPYEIANAVLFLASSDADGIVGHDLPVCGGSNVKH